MTCGSPIPLFSTWFGIELHADALCPSPVGVAVPALTPPPLGLCVTVSLSLQTYIGSIIASLNPYKPIAGLYERATMERYSKSHLGELPPHVFAVANECYRCLWKRHDNQCVLIR